MSSATETKTTVRPFGVEADHPRNGDVRLQGVQNCVLRSRIKQAVEVLPSTKVQDPMQTTRIAQASLLPGTPEVPGMEIHVNPAAGTYAVIDPLCGNDALCTHLSAVMSAAGRISSHAKVTGVPPQKGALGEHRMKTLCRELRRLLDEGHVRVKKGSVPTLEQVDAMPGYYLQNPGAVERNSQPQFEHQMAEWQEGLDKFGG